MSNPKKSPKRPPAKTQGTQVLSVVQRKYKILISCFAVSIILSFIVYVLYVLVYSSTFNSASKVDSPVKGIFTPLNFTWGSKIYYKGLEKKFKFRTSQTTYFEKHTHFYHPFNGDVDFEEFCKFLQTFPYQINGARLSIKKSNPWPLKIEDIRRITYEKLQLDEELFGIFIPLARDVLYSVLPFNDNFHFLFTNIYRSWLINEIFNLKKKLYKALDIFFLANPDYQIYTLDLAFPAFFDVTRRIVQRIYKEMFSFTEGEQLAYLSKTYIDEEYFREKFELFLPILRHFESCYFYLVFFKVESYENNNFVFNVHEGFIDKDENKKTLIQEFGEEFIIVNNFLKDEEDKLEEMLFEVHGESDRDIDDKTHIDSLFKNIHRLMDIFLELNENTVKDE